MTSTTSQPGDDLLPEIKATFPARSAIKGQYVSLRPLQPSDADSLFHHLGGTANSSLWDFMPDGPFPTPGPFAEGITRKSESQDPLFFAVVDAQTGGAVGHVSFMRVDVANRTVELGHLIYSRAVQRSRVTTEIIFLMMRLVFEELGYRRCEWKCNDLNGPSKRAAGRFGFVFEGVFRQHMIVKGKNRDTAWFAVLDREWEVVKAGFLAWLDPANFDGEGRQKRTLEQCRNDVK